MTMIGGSNVAGKTMPPHLQYPSAAKEENTQFYPSTVLEFMEVECQYGHPDSIWAAGMDAVEFRICSLKMINWLFPMLEMYQVSERY
jgi:hypothetical protein